MMTSSVGATRKKSASDLLLAGLSAIAEVGIDRVTVSNVTSSSGVSRPTFYTYFGDINGYFAEIWLEFGEAWLDYQLGVKPPKALNLEGELEEQDFDQALLEVFVAARRIPELREIVQPDLEEWWTKNTQDIDARELNLAWKLSVVLGEKLSRAVSQKAALALAYLQTFDVPDDWAKRPEFAEVLSNPYVKYELPPVELIGEDIDSRLTAAAVSVISGAGMVNTSLTRVARRARVSTGSVYPRFKNIEALIEKSFLKVMERLIMANIELAKNNGRTLLNYGSFVNSGFLPKRKIWRNFRNEMHLAALHNPAIAKLMAPAFEAASQQLKSEITRGFVPDELGEQGAWLMHDQAIGSSVLHGLLPRIGDLDHRVMLVNIEKYLQPKPSVA